jgi:hypothetical protein
MPQPVNRSSNGLFARDAWFGQLRTKRLLRPVPVKFAAGKTGMNPCRAARIRTGMSGVATFGMWMIAIVTAATVTAAIVMTVYATTAIVTTAKWTRRIEWLVTGLFRIESGRIVVVRIVVVRIGWIRDARVRTVPVPRWAKAR